MDGNMGNYRQTILHANKKQLKQAQKFTTTNL